MTTSFTDATAKSGRTRFGKFGSITLAFLLVSATAVPFLTGLAAAETVYTQTVDASGQRFVVVNGGGIDGDFTIEMTVSGDQIPGRNEDTILFRKTVGDGYAIQEFAFVNAGAYETVDVRVTVPDSSSGSPTITAESGALVVQEIASSGGDADLSCDLAESINSAALTGIVDCNPLPTQGINTTELNANETKISIYQTAAQQKTATETRVTTWDNYRNGYETDAIIAGKNAYIRELVNGTSESVARSRARQAVRDYWATHQLSLIQSWNASAQTVEFLNERAMNATGVGDYFVSRRGSIQGSNPGYSLEDATLSLTNSTSTGVERLRYNYANYDDSMIALGKYNSDTGDWYGAEVSEAPYQNGKIFLLESQDWNRIWNEMEASSSETVSQVDTFANNTYEAYQDGDINTSDLIDPYLARARLAPENDSDYQAWALTALAGLGTATPETLENTGRMVVLDETTNTTLDGILLSQELPANDTFSVGETYNASEIGGGQYVVTASGTVELTGEFTPQSFETKDGTVQQSVTYKNVTYQTANLSDYRNLMRELSTLQAEIDARQEEANRGTTGIPLSGIGEEQIIFLAVAGGLVVLLFRG